MGSTDVKTLKAEEANEGSNLKVNNDLEKGVVNQFDDEPDNNAENVIQKGNDEVEDAREQVAKNVKDLAQKGKDIGFDERGDEAEDELDEFEDDLVNRPKSAKELQEANYTYAEDIGDDLNNGVKIQ